MARNPWTGVDALEADELSRIQRFYADALEQAIKNQKKFLKKVADVDSGKIKPPYAEEETEKIKKWREGFVREQLRQQKVIDGIMADINKAGQIAAGTIQDTSIDIYSKSREMQAETLKNEAKTWLNKEPNFAMYNKRQIGVLLQKEQSPFSKIAYQNLGQNDAIRRRLQNEMAIAIINGESQEKMMKRIRDVVGNAEYNARRTAQTERTRIQAQATHEVATEAHAMGIRTYKKWSTRMINSRDNHIALNGACALTNELFKYSADGSEVDYPMMYPADPSAPASEVCNCHCTYIEHVLLDDEDVQYGKLINIVNKNSSEPYMVLTSYDYDKEEEKPRHENVEDIVKSASKRITTDMPLLDDYCRVICYGNTLSDGVQYPAMAQLGYVGNYPGMAIVLDYEQWKDLNKLREYRDKPKGIIAHEYGHIAHYALAFKNIGYSGKGPLTNEQYKLFIMEHISIAQRIEEHLKKLEIKTESVYNIDEQIAIAFSDYYYGKKDAKSKMIVKFFKEGLKK